MLDIKESSSGLDSSLLDIDRIVNGETASRRSTILSLIVAVVAGVAALVIWNNANSTSEVVVAARDLAPGSEVVESDLELVEADVIGSSYSNKSSVVGYVVQHYVAAGDLLEESDLGSQRLIAEDLTVVGVLASPGMFPTPDISSGDLVDVFGIDPETQRSSLIASEARVYNVVNPDSGATSDLLISVEVSPTAAAKIATASLSPDGVRFTLRAR